MTELEEDDKKVYLLKDFESWAWILHIQPHSLISSS